MRIIIAGGPRVGKSTLARKLSLQYKLTQYCADPSDKVKDPEPQVQYVPALYLSTFPEKERWSAASEYVARLWMTRTDDWVLDGVGTVRALRKYREINGSDELPPCDKFIYIERHPFKELSKGQATMTAGVKTIFEDIRNYMMPVWHDLESLE